MFKVNKFKHAEAAAAHVINILTSLPTPRAMEYQVIHSLSQTECDEDGGKIEVMDKVLRHFLCKLDEMQGVMLFDTDEQCWDYIDWEEPEDVYNVSNEIYVKSHEGFVVLHNPFAICEDQFPVVVVKNSFWQRKGAEAQEILKSCDFAVDYTCNISPAVYVELYYAT